MFSKKLTGKQRKGTVRKEDTTEIAPQNNPLEKTVTKRRERDPTSKMTSREVSHLSCLRQSVYLSPFRCASLLEEHYRAGALRAKGSIQKEVEDRHVSSSPFLRPFSLACFLSFSDQIACVFPLHITVVTVDCRDERKQS